VRIGYDGESFAHTITTTTLNNSTLSISSS